VSIYHNTVLSLDIYVTGSLIYWCRSGGRGEVVGGIKHMQMKTQLIFLKCIVVLLIVGVQCGIYKSSYNISNISYLHSLPPPFFFIFPPLLHGIVSAGLTFPFTHKCIQCFHHIHFPMPIPHHLLPPTGPTLPSRQDLFLSPELQFCKRKK
jgi:hypothetical protein